MDFKILKGGGGNLKKKINAKKKSVFFQLEELTTSLGCPDIGLE